MRQYNDECDWVIFRTSRSSIDVEPNRHFKNLVTTAANTVQNPLQLNIPECQIFSMNSQSDGSLFILNIENSVYKSCLIQYANTDL